MTPELVFLMLLGMGNGLLHAFDADHIVAVTALAGSGENPGNAMLRTAVMWSVGHGAVLLVIVLLAMGLGLVISPVISSIAELLIGIILVLVGVGILTPVFRRRVKISRHKHGDQPAHTHFHRENHRAFSDHRPVLVGMVHGVAGSAPLLAVLPALFQKNYTAAGAYIVLFSLCVCLAMCLFGGLFGRLSHSVFKRLDRGFIYLQRFLGLQAIGFGVYWISLAI